MSKRHGGTQADRELMRGLFRLEQDRREGGSLLRDLQTGVREWSSLTAEERDRLRGAPSIELLMARCLDLRYSDPEAMLRCGELAVQMADSLCQERYGSQLLADLKAKAWGILANAHRVADQLGAAEEGFAKAVSYLESGTGAPQVLTQISEMMAVLYRDQRRFAKAVELLESLGNYYRSIGDSESLTRILLSRGLVADQDNDPEEAIRWLRQALKFLPPGSPLRLSTIHSLTGNLLEADYPLEAKAILEKYEGLYKRSGRLNVLRRFWLQGRILVALGHSRRAEGDLNVARLGFKNAGQNYDAALVSLDLALIYARTGQRTSTIRLVDEMVRTFRELGIAREAIASLLLLRKHCDRHWNPETICARIETIALTVAELGRRQERRRPPKS